MNSMFKEYLKDMKAVFIPATITYIIAIFIHILTGLSVDIILICMFSIVLIFIFSWAGYLYIKEKFYK